VKNKVKTTGQTPKAIQEVREASMHTRAKEGGARQKASSPEDDGLDFEVLTNDT
jgi:hypothetical protein